MPGMKAVGTNTAERTSAMPITGPEISSIAFKAASLGASPSSMCRSTASTTTMASSTTRPIASTRPNRESVRSEEHTSELQSLAYLVCRLLLEKKKKKNMEPNSNDHKNEKTKLTPGRFNCCCQLNHCKTHHEWLDRYYSHFEHCRSADRAGTRCRD